MSHFEIFVTAYSLLSTIGMGLTVYYGREFVLAVEKRAKLLSLEALEAVESTVKAHVTAEFRPLHVRVLNTELAVKNTVLDSMTHAEARADEIKTDIARVEKWITDHAEELKNRAEDLRVRALDLHDKTQTSITRQPPTR